MPLSPAHEVIGLAVYQRAEGKPITMATVHQVLAELAAHADCSCRSCLWVGKADPVKTWLAAAYWVGCGRSFPDEDFASGGRLNNTGDDD